MTSFPTRHDVFSDLYTRTFDYGYAANSALVSELTADNANSFRMEREYDPQRNLLKSIDTEWTSGGSLASRTRFDYVHNDRGERSSAQMSGSAFADYYTTAYQAVTHYYGYNGKGELQSAALYGGTAVTTPASNTEIHGRRFEYRYDGAGNRTSSGPTGNPASVDNQYTINSLNQYTAKENNTVSVSGVAAISANVAIPNGTALKRDRAWGGEFLPPNTNNAVQGLITILAAIPGGGTGGADLIASTTRLYFVPKAAQVFGYDADGNMTHDSVWTYAYDAENRLISMEHRSEVIGTGMIPTADARRLEFTYDYLGRRVKKRVLKGWTGSSYPTLHSERRYLYDGWNLVAEYSVSGSTLSLVRSYTWGLDLASSMTATGGVGALVQIHDYAYEGGMTFLPAYDGNGNVVALANAATGDLEATYEYSPFGELIRCEGDYAKENPFRFSTKFHDQESGLVYYGLRYYSSTLGRFINRDPIGEQGGLNLYGFVGNNAVNRYDMLGMYRVNEIYTDGPSDDNWRGFERVNENTWYDPDGDVRYVFMGWAREDGDQYNAYEDEDMGINASFGHSIWAKDDGDLAMWRQSNAIDTDAFLARQPVAPGVVPGEIGLYLVKKDPVTGKWKVSGATDGVTTDHAFVNGITGSLDEHAELGGDHIENLPDGGSVTEYTLFNNPSNGALLDMWETLRDKMGLTTEPARSLAGALRRVAASDQKVHWVAHSQGGAIFSEAMRVAGGDLSGNSVTFNAGANNKSVTDRIARKVGVAVKGHYGSPWDAVPNVVGGNGNPATIIGSIIASPLLVTPASDHTRPNSRYERF